LSPLLKDVRFYRSFHENCNLSLIKEIQHLQLRVLMTTWKQVLQEAVTEDICCIGFCKTTIQAAQVFD